MYTIYRGWDEEEVFPRATPEPAVGGGFDPQRRERLLQQLGRINERMSFDSDFSLIDGFDFIVRRLAASPYGIGITSICERAEGYCGANIAANLLVIGDKLAIDHLVEKETPRAALEHAVSRYLETYEDSTIEPLRAKRLGQLRAALGRVREDHEPRGWIYCFHMPERGLVKIGHTGRNDARTRLAEVQRGTPDTIELIYLMRGYQSEEVALHRFFEPHRVRGEWFRYEGSVKEWLEGQGISIR